MPAAAPANPASLTVREFCQITGAEEDEVRQHLKDGLPVGPGERMNLIECAAWLLERLDG